MEKQLVVAAAGPRGRSKDALGISLSKGADEGAYLLHGRGGTGQRGNPHVHA